MMRKRSSAARRQEARITASALSQLDAVLQEKSNSNADADDITQSSSSITTLQGEETEKDALDNIYQQERTCLTLRMLHTRARDLKMNEIPDRADAFGDANVTWLKTNEKAILSGCTEEERALRLELETMHDDKSNAQPQLRLSKGQRAAYAKSPAGIQEAQKLKHREEEIKTHIGKSCTGYCSWLSYGKGEIVTGPGSTRFRATGDVMVCKRHGFFHICTEDACDAKRSSSNREEISCMLTGRCYGQEMANTAFDTGISGEAMKRAKYIHQGTGAKSGAAHMALSDDFGSVTADANADFDGASVGGATGGGGGGGVTSDMVDSDVILEVFKGAPMSMSAARSSSVLRTSEFYEDTDGIAPPSVLELLKAQALQNPTLSINEKPSTKREQNIVRYQFSITGPVSSAHNNNNANNKLRLEQQARPMIEHRPSAIESELQQQQQQRSLLLSPVPAALRRGVTGSGFQTETSEKYAEMIWKLCVSLRQEASSEANRQTATMPRPGRKPAHAPSLAKRTEDSARDWLKNTKNGLEDQALKEDSYHETSLACERIKKLVSSICGAILFDNSIRESMIQKLQSNENDAIRDIDQYVNRRIEKSSQPKVAKVFEIYWTRISTPLEKLLRIGIPRVERDDVILDYVTECITKLWFIYNATPDANASKTRESLEQRVCAFLYVMKAGFSASVLVRKNDQMVFPSGHRIQPPTAQKSLSFQARHGHVSANAARVSPPPPPEQQLANSDYEEQTICFVEEHAWLSRIPDPGEISAIKTSHTSGGVVLTPSVTDVVFATTIIRRAFMSLICGKYTLSDLRLFMLRNHISVFPI